MKKDITAIANKNFHWRICFNLSSCKFVTKLATTRVLVIADAVETVLCYLGYWGFTPPPHFLHPNFILNATEFRQVKNAIDMCE